MRLSIDNKTTIREIKNEFNRMFPFLKLEFFSKLHDHGTPTSKKFMQKEDVKLSEIRHSDNPGFIEVDPGMKVTDLEDAFGQKFGLGVQVFRKSGKLWLETTVTDNWTLEDQNNQGEALGRIIT